MTAGRSRVWSPAVRCQAPRLDQSLEVRFRHGETAEYLTARIARDRPDILEQMKAGEFKIVRHAAIASGLIRPPDQLEICRKLYLKLSPREREQFLGRVSAQD